MGAGYKSNQKHEAPDNDGSSNTERADSSTTKTSESVPRDSPSKSDKPETAQSDRMLTAIESKTTSNLGPHRGAEGFVYIAAHYGLLRLLNRLLETGANPNLQGRQQCTALQAACARGKAEMVESLLKHGADPNLHRKSCLNPLQAACDSGSLAIVQILVQAGANVHPIGTRPLILYVPLLNQLFNRRRNTKSSISCIPKQRYIAQQLST